MSAVIVVSRHDKSILWHLDSTVVAQQHNATELDNGHFLIYDNGTFRHNASFQFSRVLEVEPSTKAIVWAWTDPSPERFFSPFMGGAQRLPHGHTLVCESAFGRIFEIDADDNVCWEYISPYFQHYAEPELRAVFPSDSNALFRAYKYAPEQCPWLT